MNSNNSFDTEESLSVGESFSKNGVQDDDVYMDTSTNNIEEFPSYTAVTTPTLESQTIDVPMENLKTEVSVGLAVNEITFPSFFDFAKRKEVLFESNGVDNFSQKFPEKEGRVSVDLDNENPIEVSQKVKEMYLVSQIKADIVSYVDSEPFENISFSDMLILVNVDSLDKELYLLDTVEKLIHNENLKENRELLKKLYKLRPTRTLIEEALMIEAAYERNREFKMKVKEIVVEWERAVREKINADFEQYKIAEVAKEKQSSISIANKLKNDNLNLVNRHEDALRDADKKFNELKKYHEDFLISLSEIISGGEIIETEEIISSISYRFSEAAEKDNNSGIVATLKNEIDSYKEELEMIQESNRDIEAELENVSQEKKELLSQNEALKSENNSLKEELAKKPLAVSNPKDSLILDNKNDYEDEEKHEEEDEDENESPKKGALSKKQKDSLIIVVVVIAAIVVLFMVLSWFVGGDEAPATKANYATPAVSSAQPVQAAPQTPSAVPVEAVKQEVIINPVSEYNFETKISEADFQSQKFDIYVSELSKIRINGRDFMTNDIINGYKFVKAMNNGKILFIKDDKEPLWVEMKK